MVRHKPRLTDFIFAPCKVGLLAALPLLAGVEIGNRASAGDGITGATERADVRAPVAGRAFDSALARGYRELADSLEKSSHSASPNDWADAQYFALKAMAADRGENDGPEKASYWTLSPETRSEIEAARPRVAAAVDQIPDTSSNLAAVEAAANAQVNFDCWVERSEEADEAAAAADCRQSLETALSDFDAAIGGQGISAATGSFNP